MLPRQIIPGVRYLLTRRCARGEFRLRPCAETNRIIRWALGWAIGRSGVVVHAICVMSNHLHIVLTDVRGQLPIFARELHRTIAKALNALHDRDENVWRSGSYHIVQLDDEAAVVDAIAYVVSNPVSAGLVASPSHWPGVLLFAAASAVIVEEKRPAVYFAKAGRMPERVRFAIEPLDFDDFGARIEAAIEAKVHAARMDVARRRQSFLGRRRVLLAPITQRAERSDRTRQRVRARDRARPRNSDATREAYAQFLRDYNDALFRWSHGNRTVHFPIGTWWMRTFHGARVWNDGGGAPTTPRTERAA